MGKRKPIPSELVAITRAARLLGVGPEVLRNTEGLEKIRLGRRTYVAKSQLYELFGRHLERQGLYPKELQPERLKSEGTDPS